MTTTYISSERNKKEMNLVKSGVPFRTSLEMMSFHKDYDEVLNFSSLSDRNIKNYKPKSPRGQSLVGEQRPKQ